MLISMQPYVARQAPLSWDSPGKNTGVGCHALLQGIAPTQGSNSHLLLLLRYRWILSPLSHLGSPEYMRAGGIHALHRPAMGTCQLWPGYTEMSIPRGHSSQLCHLTWQLFNIKSLGWSEIEYSDDTH